MPCRLALALLLVALAAGCTRSPPRRRGREASFADYARYPLEALRDSCAKYAKDVDACVAQRTLVSVVSQECPATSTRGGVPCGKVFQRGSELRLELPAEHLVVSGVGSPSANPLSEVMHPVRVLSAEDFSPGGLDAAVEDCARRDASWANCPELAVRAAISAGLCWPRGLTDAAECGGHFVIFPESVVFVVPEEAVVVRGTRGLGF